MARVVLFLLIFIAGVSILTAPWITGLAYVANSLVQPQYIWFWVFEGVPIFRITAGLAIVGLCFAVAQRKANFEIYKNKQNIMIFIIWLWMHLSHQLSSFPGASTSVSPEVVLSTINSIVIMYFVLLALCNSEKALIYLCYTFIFAGVYYIYWSNFAYINQEWYKFINGRLAGPIGSPYRDGNVLSTLIVMCVPFIILLYFKSEKLLFRCFVLMVVPLAWHAMILFSSRAALLASAITLLVLAYVLRSKKANILIGASFVIFLVYQGALLLERTADTIEASKIESETPINPRLVSWEAGFRLIPEYPFFGAGVQMFEAATRAHFPEMTPHVAHNTFLNFSANTGLLTGLLFVAIILVSVKRLRLTRNQDFSLKNNDYYALTASSISIIGFFVCSCFLDLIIYEPFYIALIINLISYQRVMSRQECKEIEADNLNCCQSVNSPRTCEPVKKIGSLNLFINFFDIKLSQVASNSAVKTRRETVH